MAILFNKGKTVMRRVAPAILALAALGNSGDHQVGRPIVSVEGGSVVGRTTKGISVWRGIPFAAAPIGALRWRPPQPVTPWKEPRLADEFGASCPQVKLSPTQLAPIGTLSEDCLFLNIWAPADRTKRHPVMVWIHGGGFIAGSGSEAHFDGNAFARKGIALVTINYRLGRLGFFAHPALSAEHPDELHGNYGLMDQIAALRWVRSNIEQFGGDPNNVTLFGESAGAASTLALSVAPEAQKLFHKMIVQSAPMRLPMRDIREDRPGMPSAEEVGKRWAASMGIPDGPDAPSSLRRLPVDRISPPAPDLPTIMGIIKDGGPMIDEMLLSGPLLLTFQARPLPSKPMVVGTNTQEGSVWSFEGGSVGLTPIFGLTGKQALAQIDGPAEREAIRNSYVNAAGGVEERAEALLLSDVFMGADAFSLAQIASERAPTWLYRFDAAPAHVRASAQGSPHGTDIFYVFGTLDKFPHQARKVSRKDRTNAKQMIGYWASFAATGKPTASGAPKWLPFDLAKPTALTIRNTSMTNEPIDNPDIMRMLSHR